MKKMKVEKKVFRCINLREASFSGALITDACILFNDIINAMLCDTYNLMQFDWPNPSEVTRQKWACQLE